MATEATPEGNGLWVSLSDLARMRGVTKGPLSRRVTRLESQGVSLSKAGPGGVKLINVAAFDRAAGESTDIVRATNGGASAPVVPDVPVAAGPVDQGALVYAREQARNAAYSADLKRLDLDERLGKLLPTERVVDAMTTCAAAIVRALDGLPSMADEIAAAVARDGSSGVRRLLKGKVVEMRDTLAREMTKLEAQGRAEHEAAETAANDASADQASASQ